MITRERKGFTLIEILIVVAIIAILASIVLVGLGPTQQSGRDARRLSDLHEIQNGLELYYNACGYYPGTAAATPCLAYAAATGYEAVKATIISFTSLGISQMPDDPNGGAQYYYVSSGGTSYILQADLENLNNSVFTSYTAPTAAVIATYTDGDTTKVDCVGASGHYCVSL